MAFDKAMFHERATAGDVGATALLARHALAVLADAIERIAAQTGVDVGEGLREAREDIGRLDGEFRRLTGYQPE